MPITTCDSCAAGIANADWTHLYASCCCNTSETRDRGEGPPRTGHDDDCEAERLFALTSANLERLGWLTPDGDADMPGYFDCEVCWETQCGGGHRFLTE